MPGFGECIFRRQYRIAEWRGRTLELEDRVVPPGRIDELDEPPAPLAEDLGDKKE